MDSTDQSACSKYGPRCARSLQGISSTNPLPPRLGPAVWRQSRYSYARSSGRFYTRWQGFSTDRILPVVCHVKHNDVYMSRLHHIICVHSFVKRGCHCCRSDVCVSSMIATNAFKGLSCGQIAYKIPLWLYEIYM